MVVQVRALSEEPRLAVDQLQQRFVVEVRAWASMLRPAANQAKQKHSRHSPIMGLANDSHWLPDFPNRTSYGTDAYRR